MAKITPKEEEDLVNAFMVLSDVWGKTRSGIIISFSGTRVGSWQWIKSKLFVKSENKDFQDVVRQLGKDGILTRVPIKSITEDKNEPGNSSGLEIVSLNEATPGLLDIVLKELGYFLIDLNLPLAPEK